jgi:hypothetical protein
MDHGGRVGIRVHYDHVGIGMPILPGGVKRREMDVASSAGPRLEFRRVMLEEAGDSSEFIRSEVEGDLTELEQVESLIDDRPLIPIYWHS